MLKKELRQLYLQRRAALTAVERQRLDDLLLIQFQQLELPFVSALMNYWPMNDKGEPDTHLFEDYLAFRNPGMRVAYPRTKTVSGNLEAVWVNEDTRFAKAKFNVTEPVDGEPADPASFDIVITPLLVADLRGYRVGYGKGYYDRFLVNCRKGCLKIGFSYFEPVNEISDTHEFDVPLSICVTPKNRYVF